MNYRIAISVEEIPGKKETVAEHFGRCSKFIVCEINSQNEVVGREIYFNPLKGHHEGQCQLPAYIKQFDVKTIIAGGMGRKAVSNFHNFGIEVVTAPGLDFNEALESYLAGNLSGYEECSGHNHH